MQAHASTQISLTTMTQARARSRSARNSLYYNDPGTCVQLRASKFIMFSI